MSINTPIFSIAKDLNVESNRILLACKKNKVKTKSSSKKIVEKVKIKYFANRLIRKS